MRANVDPLPWCQLGWPLCVSKKMKGPTSRRALEGSNRATVKPPRSRCRASIIVSMAGVDARLVQMGLSAWVQLIVVVPGGTPTYFSCAARKRLGEVVRAARITLTVRDAATRRPESPKAAHLKV